MSRYEVAQRAQGGPLIPAALECPGYFAGVRGTTRDLTAGCSGEAVSGLWPCRSTTRDEFGRKRGVSANKV
jgi:hypothetical protein